MGSLIRKKIALLFSLTITLNLIALNTFSDPFETNLEQLNELSPQPGADINSKNFKYYKNLIDPDIAKFILKDHFSMQIGAPISIKPHPAFIFATRQGRSRLLCPIKKQNYSIFHLDFLFTNGQIQDPDAGIKLAFNMRYAYKG